MFGALQVVLSTGWNTWYSVTWYFFFYSDGAWFNKSGYVNSQNNRIWSTKNLHAFHETPFHTQKTGVWCTTSCAHIVGPIFFDTTVNSEVYLNVINQFNAVLEVDKWCCLFQQDSAAYHTSNDMRSILGPTSWLVTCGLFSLGLA